MSENRDNAGEKENEYPCYEKKHHSADESGGGDNEKKEEKLHGMLTPLNAVNFYVVGVPGALWIIPLFYYWITVAQWLYKNLLQEEMSRSLWTTFAAFFNIFAVLVPAENQSNLGSLCYIWQF